MYSIKTHTNKTCQKQKVEAIMSGVGSLLISDIYPANIHYINVCSGDPTFRSDVVLLSRSISISGMNYSEGFFPHKLQQ